MKSYFILFDSSGPALVLVPCSSSRLLAVSFQILHCPPFWPTFRVPFENSVVLNFSKVGRHGWDSHSYIRISLLPKAEVLRQPVGGRMEEPVNAMLEETPTSDTL